MSAKADPMHATTIDHDADARSTTRSKRSIVEKKERCSIDCAEICCDSIRLRVQSRATFGCSIRWNHERRSITELNSDSHSQRFIVSTRRRHTDGTHGSCGAAPSPTSAFPFPKSSQQVSSCLRDAGPAPAFSMPAASQPRRRPMHAPAAAPARGRRACRAEFISVSGQCSDRSAHSSDLRPKRTSGGVAATKPPRAPMNSSSGRLPGRVAFSTIL